jgi:hypothetical protein
LPNKKYRTHKELMLSSEKNTAKTPRSKSESKDYSKRDKLLILFFVIDFQNYKKLYKE